MYIHYVAGSIGYYAKDKYYYLRNIYSPDMYKFIKIYCSYRQVINSLIIII